MQVLMHVKVGYKLKKRMKLLIDSGLFNNQVEIVREGIRDLLSKYHENQNLGKRKMKNA